MSTDPTIFQRLYLANVSHNTIKQYIAMAPEPMVKLDNKQLADTIGCTICMQVPKHYKNILSCANGHIHCVGCQVYSQTAKCAYCRDPTVYFKNPKIQKIIENGIIAEESCFFCPIRASYPDIVIHERTTHKQRLPYIPHDNPRRTLNLNADDWKDTMSCSFCNQIIQPGTQLNSCQEGHVHCRECQPANKICTVEACDLLLKGRPHTLEQLIGLIHNVQTFSCPTPRCQFRSTIPIVLAHERICKDPHIYNPPYNDFRTTPNCREEIIQFKHPQRTHVPRNGTPLTIYEENVITIV